MTVHSILRGAAILAAFIASTAFGQSATAVLSGEHATFSRLVFAAAPDLSWSVEKQQDTAGSQSFRIRFDRQTGPLDLSTVFDKIPRTRVRSVRTISDGLSIQLACDCKITVAQIPSNHIVIDILDPADERADAREQVPPTPPVVLPLQLSPVSSLALGFVAPDGPQENPDEDQVDDIPDVANTEILPQISIREHARRGLLPSSPDAEGSRVTLQPACSLETLAARLLLRDPVAALADLQVLRVAIVDDADRIQDTRVIALAEAYLATGWGAEAGQILNSVDSERKIELGQIARAIDGDPDLINAPFEADASCGPATTTLLLVSGQFDGPWGSVDEEAFVRFIDRLSLTRRADLEPRLFDSLSRLGHEDVLLRLAALPEVPVPYSPPSEDIVAAGTDTNAVRAMIGIISAGLDEAKDGVPEFESIHLQNALALRPSVPPGPLLQEFDTVLAKALLLSGHLSETAEVVKDRPGLASALLTTALTELDPEHVVEVAIRLRPYLRSDAPDIAKAAEIMRRFGLNTTAREFEAIRAGEGISTRPLLRRTPSPVGSTNLTEHLTDEDRAWLARDFANVSTEDDPDSPSPRQTLAQAIQARNSEALPTGDFARAMAALEASRRTSQAISNLIATNP